MLVCSESSVQVGRDKPAGHVAWRLLRGGFSSFGSRQTCWPAAAVLAVTTPPEICIQVSNLRCFAPDGHVDDVQVNTRLL